MKKGNFWSPYIAGAGLGLTLLAAFIVMGKGLAASSAFSVTAAVAARAVNPGYTGGLSYFAQYFSLESPLMNWVIFELGGLFIGALAGAITSGNFKVIFDRGAHTTVPTRLFTAFAGGMLIGFASRLARGCTSGVALSGGAQLAVSGWIFVISVFVAGFITAAFFRRLWT
jgi:uncharacterized membrane protein YedE/YeeE